MFMRASLAFKYARMSIKYLLQVELNLPLLKRNPVILSVAKDLKLRILRSFAVFAAQDDGTWLKLEKP